MTMYEYSCLIVRPEDAERQLKIDVVDGYRVSHLVSHGMDLVFLLEREKKEFTECPSR